MYYHSPLDYSPPNSGSDSPPAPYMAYNRRRAKLEQPDTVLQPVSPGSTPNPTASAAAHKLVHAIEACQQIWATMHPGDADGPPDVKYAINTLNAQTLKLTEWAARHGRSFSESSAGSEPRPAAAPRSRIGTAVDAWLPDGADSQWANSILRTAYTELCSQREVLTDTVARKERMLDGMCNELAGLWSAAGMTDFSDCPASRLQYSTAGHSVSGIVRQTSSERPLDALSAKVVGSSVMRWRRQSDDIVPILPVYAGGIGSHLVQCCLKFLVPHPRETLHADQLQQLRALGRLSSCCRWADTPSTQRPWLSPTELVAVEVMTSGRHFFSTGACKICVQCYNCTGFGPRCCDSSSRTLQERTMMAIARVKCGCGDGDTGCVLCGVCKSCGVGGSCVVETDKEGEKQVQQTRTAALILELQDFQLTAASPQSYSLLHRIYLRQMLNLFKLDAIRGKTP